jgi:hypothetical protein
MDFIETVHKNQSVKELLLVSSATLSLVFSIIIITEKLHIYEII